MLIDKFRIRGIISNYIKESPYRIQYIDLDVLMKRIWEYVDRRESRVKFEIEALNLGVLVAEPAWKRGFEFAIEQVVELLNLSKKGEKEECEICHGKGSTYDHHDPCSNCGGEGYII